MMNLWRERWLARSKVERIVLLALGALLLSLIAYFLLWIPLQKSSAQLAEEIPTLRRELQLARSVEQELRAPIKTAARKLDLTEQLRRAFPQARSEQSEGQWRIQINSVNADALLHGLKTNNSAIVKLKIVALQEAGQVSAEIIYKSE